MCAEAVAVWGCSLDDSKKYDLPADEIQRLTLGLITAAGIDGPAVLKYWIDTFPGYPNFPPEDIPSCIELHTRVLGLLAGIIAGLHDVPEVQPYIEGLLDKLRTGEAL